MRTNITKQNYLLYLVVTTGTIEKFAPTIVKKIETIVVVSDQNKI